jgi:hypothetical protein
MSDASRSFKRVAGCESGKACVSNSSLLLIPPAPDATVQGRNPVNRRVNHAKTRLPRALSAGGLLGEAEPRQRPPAKARVVTGSGLVRANWP